MGTPVKHISEVFSQNSNIFDAIIVLFLVEVFFCMWYIYPFFIQAHTQRMLLCRRAQFTVGCNYLCMPWISAAIVLMHENMHTTGIYKRISK